jgi:nicotinamide phosphoribosyltransferase
MNKEISKEAVMLGLVEDFNIITATDSYKLTHYNMYPKGTEVVSSYFEARVGAKFEFNVFNSLQYLMLRYMQGQVVTQDNIEWADYLAELHFGQKGIFNRAGWEYILNEYGGRLPIQINAVAEGTPVPTGNVMMQVINTDKRVPWLTNALESFLTHVWSGTTGASLSRYIKTIQKRYLELTSDVPVDAILPFMLHDFGYRGGSSDESTRQVGVGHLINYMGTDTIPAIEMAVKYYGAGLGDKFNAGFSVNATEHSVMTSMGEEGEFDLVDELLDEYPTGILSVVIDSYDWKRFIETMGTPRFKERILNREGKFVFRPDSGEPIATSLAVYQAVANEFGFTTNSKGYEVLNPQVGCLWGDGVNEDDVENIYSNLANNGVSADNYIIGMGGNLHQKINRDTQRNAFKASYQERDGVGYNIFKDPIDGTKKSKKGRLALVKENGQYKTIQEVDSKVENDLLIPVFRNGEVIKTYTLDEMRKNASL